MSKSASYLSFVAHLSTMDLWAFSRQRAIHKVKRLTLACKDIPLDVLQNAELDLEERINLWREHNPGKMPSDSGIYLLLAEIKVAIEAAQS